MKNKNIRLSDLDLRKAIVDPDIVTIPTASENENVVIDINALSVLVFDNEWESPADVACVCKAEITPSDLNAIFTYLGV